MYCLYFAAAPLHYQLQTLVDHATEYHRPQTTVSNRQGLVPVRGWRAIPEDVRGFRRLGIGMTSAQEIWKKFPGKWEVRVIDRNRKAKEFWERAINEFLGETIEPIALDKDGKGWYVFSFESKCAE